MIVTVPTPEYLAIATRALRMEGIGVDEELCSEPNDYGRLVADTWDKGRPFIICEHDIIPWPGAVAALAECGTPFCTHKYPLAQGNIARGFGIGKYVPIGRAPAIWRETEWRMLDGEVVPFLLRTFGKAHVHEPPFAHARRELAA
jgi:hypothetical protein